MRTDPGGQPTLPDNTGGGDGRGRGGRRLRWPRGGGSRGGGPRGGGSPWSRWLGNAVILSSDRRRSGQDAFRASPFSRLALTHALSMAGDALVTLALAGSLFFNISPHEARGRVALSLVLTMAPFAVVAPFLGPAIDRAKGGRRVMVMVSAAGRAVACIFMARYVHGLLLFPAAFLTLVCSKAYVVSKAALVPAVVDRPEDLIEANSKLAVGGALVGFVAAIPGVAILKLLSATTLLRLDCVVFILCGISAMRIRPARHLPLEGAGGPEGAEGAGLVDGGSAEPPLPPGVVQLAAVAVGSLRYSVGFLTFLVAFAFRRGHAAAWWYGVVLAASIGGNLVGAVIAPRLRGRIKEERILAASVAAVALAGLLVMQVTALHRYPAAALFAAMVGIAAGSAKLAFDSLVQREVPAASQGRAFARFEATFQLVWVIGALVPVLIAMSLKVGFIIATFVTAAAVGAYELGGWLGRRGRLPAWWPGVRKARLSRRSRRSQGAASAPAGAPGVRGGVGGGVAPGPWEGSAAGGSGAGSAELPATAVGGTVGGIGGGSGGATDVYPAVGGWYDGPDPAGSPGPGPGTWDNPDWGAGPGVWPEPQPGPAAWPVTPPLGAGPVEWREPEPGGTRRPVGPPPPRGQPE